MTTIVYLVHGMGCGTPTGVAAPGGGSWSDDVKGAMDWIRDTFGLSEAHWMDPIPSAPPSLSRTATWIVPVSYHKAFDEFRATSQATSASVQGVASALSGSTITRLTAQPFLWQNCLDVLLWWADTTHARAFATSQINDAITRTDALARSIRGAPIRRILVAHSLGTAATTYALRYLGGSAAWRAIGFDLFVTLANVAPFLLAEGDVYAPPLVPQSSNTVVRSFLNVRHQSDPVPWLLPWRAFDPAHDPAHSLAWANAFAMRRAQLIPTAGVAAPPGGTPEITHVHGFANYLMAPGIAEVIAGAIRGAFYSPSELLALGWPGKWSTLPQLTCTLSPGALSELTSKVQNYMTFTPPGGGRPASGWFERLLDAADLLLVAKGKCP